jgi:type I restriction enzyme M protein
LGKHAYQARYGRSVIRQPVRARQNDLGLARSREDVGVNAVRLAPFPAFPARERRFLARNRNPGGKLRDRRGEVLFIDARRLGTLVDRTRKEFSDVDVVKIAGTYHAWHEGKGYADELGFCKAARLDEIKAHNHVLTPGRFVGAADIEEEDVPFSERFAILRTKLEGQFEDADRLTALIRSNLAGISGDG